MITDYIGDTPMVQIMSYRNNELFVKLEGNNVFGSAKDRAALYVLTNLLNEKVITKEDTIIESSSGNMGIALAAVGRQMGLKIKIVIDQSISKINKSLIKSFGAEVIEVTEADSNGSYLKSRLKVVQNYLEKHDHVYWFNQYGNDLVREAYRETLGKEIVRNVPDVEYIFVAVSSGGTIGGIAEAAKNYREDIKVIAVDVEGSKLYDPSTKKIKHFTGIGSSVESHNFKSAVIDDYIIMSEVEAIKGLDELLQHEQLFLGESSGCVYMGAKKYLEEHNIKGAKCVFVSHDRGERYFEMIQELKKLYHLH